MLTIIIISIIVSVIVSSLVTFFAMKILSDFFTKFIIETEKRFEEKNNLEKMLHKNNS